MMSGRQPVGNWYSRLLSWENGYRLTQKAGLSPVGTGTQTVTPPWPFAQGQRLLSFPGRARPDQVAALLAAVLVSPASSSGPWAAVSRRN